ncbi:hypothetical protein G7K_5420-t1 [Saitoella complicata NRRL Y-17804]|uniref:Eukaryotic translation initiation factor 4E n=1 Tax=Saitoella complicata (strain BCRC 22490 / CBS 7301 / JCM 7358 / NBRC 10748 / NRRL Y-17804) TaxID=698492 RepID=A0A0E9NNN9_SAICN|nr:hypothetical protein G7K_5420-t1 [Saitoella complicata NRRL Y-17804]
MHVPDVCFVQHPSPKLQSGAYGRRSQLESLLLARPIYPIDAYIMAEVAPAAASTQADPAIASTTEDIQDMSIEESTPSGPLTVFHSPEAFNVKHPLMNHWSLWFTKPPTPGQKDAWAHNLKEVISFDSVEEFWGVWNNIPKPSELAVKSDYHLFKAGVRPEWEDQQNKIGGKWAYQFKDKRAVPIDELWLHSMLAAIGETVEKDDDKEIMGVVLNCRKGFYRISLWTRTCQNKATLVDIGKKFKQVLGLSEKDILEFNSHADSAHSGTSRARSLLTV